MINLSSASRGDASRQIFQRPVTLLARRARRRSWLLKAQTLLESSCCRTFSRPA